MSKLAYIKIHEITTWHLILLISGYSSYMKLKIILGMMMVYSENNKRKILYVVTDFVIKIGKFFPRKRIFSCIISLPLHFCRPSVWPSEYLKYSMSKLEFLCMCSVSNNTKNKVKLNDSLGGRSIFFQHSFFHTANLKLFATRK